MSLGWRWQSNLVAAQGKPFLTLCPFWSAKGKLRCSLFIFQLEHKALSIFMFQFNQLGVQVYVYLFSCLLNFLQIVKGP